MPDEIGEEEPDEETLEQRRRYQRTLDTFNARTSGESADLLLDTTEEDTNWLKAVHDAAKEKKL